MRLRISKKLIMCRRLLLIKPVGLLVEEGRKLQGYRVHRLVMMDAVRRTDRAFNEIVATLSSHFELSITLFFLFHLRRWNYLQCS